MIIHLLKKIFGSRNDRLLKQYRAIVQEINTLEPTFESLSDEALRAQTEAFRARVQGGQSLDELLPEAFAVCREGAKRSLGMRHFDVQLIGGIALHQGKVAEMRTGEGKTLVATLPVYLNALLGRGVHVITVNDYLAQRDADNMGQLYRFLGLSCGVIVSQMPQSEKQAAYACDVTYGTNNEFGFDYLRDNMVYHPEERVQRTLAYGIVDEVDSILIDEARTPLIISGPAEDHIDLYQTMSTLPAKLKRQELEEGDGDYWVDEKSNSVVLSETGHERVEAILTEMGLIKEGDSLYMPANIGLVHHMNAALRAHALFNVDQHYVVQNDEIIIVDEFTGRLMPGRRWSDGLHQAVEAKEGVTINQENQTLATITLQNYFRMYTKLAGMTGTADTEAYEFQQIYHLETVIIPTNKPMIRDDRHDQVYKTAQEKYRAIIADIQDCYSRGQPVLVGTTSIEQSELLSNLLHQEKLPHNVLNAKQHAREAEVVAQAGAPGIITIATNMAGRGTDIVLGGNPEPEIRKIELDPRLTASAQAEHIDQIKAKWNRLHQQVLAAGGLHIIGSERHESRRIDNQLRGRSGRQGDPGSSRFYLSLEDALLRVFAGDRVAYVMDKLKLPEGEAIESPLVNRALESAQRKVESRNFDIRKQLLEFDDVSNEQRRAIYLQRNEILDAIKVNETIAAMRDDLMAELVDRFCPPQSMEEQWDLIGFKKATAEFGLDVPINQWVQDSMRLTTGFKVSLQDLARAHYEAKVAEVGESLFHKFERTFFLQNIDHHWREHLLMLDHLRQGIHLRSYGQKNPKQEYKREAFILFSDLLDRIRRDVVLLVMNVKIRSEAEVEAVQPAHPKEVEYHHDDLSMIGDHLDQAQEQMTEPAYPGTGRNEPCPCGDGKKYKHCHGALK